MSTRHISTKGWMGWWRRRRTALREGGVPMALAGNSATHEVRCRAKMARIIGRPAAKAMRLWAVDGVAADGPAFVLLTPVSSNEWEALQLVDELLRPLEPFPE
jgi:hypothetical protein